MTLKITFILLKNKYISKSKQSTVFDVSTKNQ